MSDTAAPAAAPDTYTRFTELHTAEWAERTAELGEQSMDAADRPPDAQLPDVSAAAQERRRQRWQSVADEVDELDALDAAGPTADLTHDQRADVAVYRYQLRTLLDQQRSRMFERPANADSAFWTDLNAMGRRRLRSADEVEAYLSWLADVPRYVDQNIVNMRAGLARGFGPPRVSMAGRDATALAVAEATSAAATPFLAPLETVPGDGADRSRDLAAGSRLIEDGVVPAYRRLATFLADEYLPHLPGSIAAHDQPDGEAFYAAQLREYTTTDLDPDEIHRIGLDEVASIRAEMEEVAAGKGFADADAMLQHMRTDPSFYPDTAAQLLHFAAWQAKQFDKVAHHFFGRLPRMRFGIEEPPPELAPIYTFGRGGPHRYILNTYDLPGRPLYSIPALTLHEAAPGHAFQVPFALEMTGLPEFRRNSYISAFGEGWALYTERLGVEMGMYETPFETMGMLSYQMWRAVRLVIDPGMHALGWSRQRGIDYLRDNTAISAHEVTTEVDRYLAWPGQAAAYYLGMLAIRDERHRAEQELGAAFDLRAFHDRVLSLGCVPLPVLSDAVSGFITGGGVSPFAG